MASLNPGPNLNCLETGEAPSRRRPSGPFLWSDWEKLTTLPLGGERCHPALTCHPLQQLLADVNQVGCSQDPFLPQLPQKWSGSPSGDHVQFMCVFSFCFKLCSSRTCPVHIPSPSEELREERVCLWEQKRRDAQLLGPPLLPTSALPAPLQPGMKPMPATSAEGPQPEAARPSAGGSWCLRPGLGWLLIPGQLFARILDINPS